MGKSDKTSNTDKKKLKKHDKKKLRKKKGDLLSDALAPIQNRKLCKIVKQYDISSIAHQYIELLLPSNYLCTKCGRAAMYKRNLCHAQTIIIESSDQEIKHTNLLGNK